MKMSKEQGKAMITSAFFVKFFLFDFLFYIKDKLDWKKKVIKKHKLQNDEMIQVELATTEMYFSGILLHGYCMDLIKEWVEVEEGNATAIDLNNVPIPLKTMVFNHVGELEEALGAKKPTKKKHGDDDDNETVAYDRLDIDQYEDDKIYRFAYIKNL
jgi:hypothetical protein